MLSMTKMPRASHFQGNVKSSEVYGYCNDVYQIQTWSLSKLLLLHLKSLYYFWFIPAIIDDLLMLVVLCLATIPSWWWWSDTSHAIGYVSSYGDTYPRWSHGSYHSPVGFNHELGHLFVTGTLTFWRLLRAQHHKFYIRSLTRFM